MIEVETIPKRAQAEQFDGETVPAILGDAASAIRWGAAVTTGSPETVPETVPVMWFPFDIVNGQNRTYTAGDPSKWGSIHPGDWVVRYPGGAFEAVAGSVFRHRFREVLSSTKGSNATDEDETPEGMG